MRRLSVRPNRLAKKQKQKEQKFQSPKQLYIMLSDVPMHRDRDSRDVMITDNGRTDGNSDTTVVQIFSCHLIKIL
jgi:hypothetical protein